ncbi:class I SAM-dependent DNA methyltransferase [uncultured Methanobrevibacter sp.]|uniref:HsdM family class I SAM-dependent methyltransferase n=1 Tax=uncultured Methanobrevibacter sp. TaxID=253161 RepID=UPI0025F6FB23|nr:N-6 DNA methylase [uncultured Methanobrevibacter sp.]
MKPAINLKHNFKRIHSYIYAHEGLHKDTAFEELQKLIFCKVYDEQFNRVLKFYILPDESDENFKNRIDDLFMHVKKRYDFIFNDNEEINLNIHTIKYIVSELYNFNLLDTNIDIKGEAYEEIVGSNLRGDKGEFFTPRNVTSMVTEMVLSLFTEDKITSPGGIKILDPALGTGGFLISTIHTIKKMLEDEKFDDIQIRDMLKEISSNNLYGLDFNPFLVKVAQMNMVMHGDGSSNVVKANSLDLPKNWPLQTQQQFGFETFDLVITNPPFGANIKIEVPEILEQYTLSKFGAKNPRSSLPPEQLFIERCLDFLKPGGYLAIVLPDSILSNPGLKWLREYIFHENFIIASIDLPGETFQPSTGTQTSVLILKKKTDVEKKINEDYDIFMALPKTVGHDRRGKPIYKQTLDGQNILDENGECIIDDSLPLVVEGFKQWLKNEGMI